MKKETYDDVKNQLEKVLEIEKALNMEHLTNLEPFVIKANKSLKEECTAITQFGDAHFDEIIKPNVINNLNEYNQDIAIERTTKYFSRVIYMLRLYKRSGIIIENLVLHLAGDFISGWIHEELVQSNVMSPIEAIRFAEELLIKGIKTIGNYIGINKIVIICNSGNHSRITNKNQFKNSVRTSYEWLLYKHLQEYFNNIPGYEHIEFIISESPFVYYKIYDKINKFSHGNHFKYHGGVGGIEVPLKRWEYRENTIMPYDMAWIGHWHQYMCGTKIRINGSVIGYNEMGRYLGFTPEPPKMQFQLLDKKRGYTWNCPILLVDWV